MTQTVSRTVSGSTPSLHPKLLQLLESGEFDWDYPRHREAYLRAWVRGGIRSAELGQDDDDVGDYQADADDDEARRDLDQQQSGFHPPIIPERCRA